MSKGKASTTHSSLHTKNVPRAFALLHLPLPPHIELSTLKPLIKSIHCNKKKFSQVAPKIYSNINSQPTNRLNTGFSLNVHSVIVNAICTEYDYCWTTFCAYGKRRILTHDLKAKLLICRNQSSPLSVYVMGLEQRTTLGSRC